MCNAQIVTMRDEELLALPSVTGSATGIDGLAALERVDWSDAERLPEAELATPVTMDEWLGLLRGADQSGDIVRTICTVQLRGLPDYPALGSGDLQSIAGHIGRTHAPEAGIAVDGEDIVLALPAGVSWVATATTVERAVIALGRPATSVHVGFGLADSGSDGQSLDDAIRLSRFAAPLAYERNLGACIMTLADEAFLGRDQLVADCLERALDADQGLRLVFQPKIDTGTQGFVGAEALLRFECEELGHVGPAEFFPIAARSGLLARLEQWVIEHAIPQIAQMASESGLAVPVSINVRGADLFADGFVESIGALIEQSDLDPRLLRVEVSEADVLARIARSEERLGALRKLGVSVALDDFGKDGATLADLRRLPLDVVKVHRAFTRDLETDETSAALIQGVMSLARVLGIETVAVGVESWSQFERLRAYGCGAVQGFLFSRPLEAAEFVSGLDRKADFRPESNSL